MTTSSNDLVLPDSRVRNPKATVMVDWPLTNPDGTTRVVRLELEPIYCANCGKPNGYVPREVVSWVCWFCPACHEVYGEEAAVMAAPDQVFWAAVMAEMESRFGHVLSQIELEYLADQGKLGTALEALERESPYRKSLPS